MITLPYGRVPYLLDLGGRQVPIVEPPRPPPPPALRSVLDSALDAPMGRARLETMVPANARVTVIVSDGTRTEPRAAFIEALRARLPAARWSIAIATGTHGRSGIVGLGLPTGIPVIDHDGHADRDLVSLGETSRGTPVRVHRCLVETDLVIATGCIRPHYFAGFGAGVKAIFPGLGGAREIRINHALKQHPGARAGIVDGNPCRADLEEAAELLLTPTFLLNAVCASDDSVQAAVAGDPVVAFRAGAELARPWFTVRAPRARTVIASDRLPVTGSLYQAAKIAAAVAPLATEQLVIVAECAEGIGPLSIVNDAIFRIGVLPRVAPGVRLGLVSSLADSDVRQTLLEPIHSLVGLGDDLLVVPQASQLLVEAV